MDTAILKDLGLTDSEIKVYLTLLELGSTSAGSVIDRSGLQNPVVHRAFHSLTAKGLVTFIYEGKIKRYQAADPEHLLEYIDEKKDRVQQLLPQLRLRQQLAPQKPKAVLFQGVRGVKEMLHALLSADAEELILYGGTKRANELLGDYFWNSLHDRRIRKRIPARLLFHQSLKYWGTQMRKKKLTQVRYTAQAFEEVTETAVCGSKVAIAIYTGQPYGVLIEEPLAARSYHHFFDVLWKAAEG